MSLPNFPDRQNTPSREEVINQIISSIAMEELGLSHIINAEGEKLQYALGTIDGITGPDEPLTVDELLKLNESVQNMLNSNMMNQFFLKEKLVKALTASIMEGPTGPTGATGATGPAEPFLSSYMEAVANGQTVASLQNVVFDLDSIDSVGNNIDLDSSGTIFTINRTGLYHIEWNINLAPESANAVVGILENGEPVTGAAGSGPGSLSSGALIEVEDVPLTISLINYDDEITIVNPVRWENSAASIRIVRFADGPSM